MYMLIHIDIYAFFVYYRASLQAGEREREREIKRQRERERERDREREREKFIGNQERTEGQQAQRPVG